MIHSRWQTVRAVCALCVMLLFCSMGLAHAEAGAGHAKYVILLIGDGMGMAQRNAAETYLAAQKGDVRPGIVKLNMLPLAGRRSGKARR